MPTAAAAALHRPGVGVAGALPLRGVNTLAVTGPNAERDEVMLGNYHGVPPYTINVVKGLAAMVKDVRYSMGCDMASNNTGGIPQAVHDAAAADATVLVLGLDQTQEREGHDRTQIGLPAAARDDACGRRGPRSRRNRRAASPLLQHAPRRQQLLRPSSSSSAARALTSSRVAGLRALRPAIIVRAADACRRECAARRGAASRADGGRLWDAQSGGQAVAEAIFGAFSPSGRLPVTWYPSDYVNQVLMIDMHMRPNATTGACAPARCALDGSLPPPGGPPPDVHHHCRAACAEGAQPGAHVQVLHREPGRAVRLRDVVQLLLRHLTERRDGAAGGGQGSRAACHALQGPAGERRGDPRGRGHQHGRHARRHVGAALRRAPRDGRGAAPPQAGGFSCPWRDGAGHPGVAPLCRPGPAPERTGGDGGQHSRPQRPLEHARQRATHRLHRGRGMLSTRGRDFAPRRARNAGGSLPAAVLCYTRASRRSSAGASKARSSSTLAVGQKRAAHALPPWCPSATGARSPSRSSVVQHASGHQVARAAATALGEAEAASACLRLRQGLEAVLLQRQPPTRVLAARPRPEAHRALRVGRREHVPAQAAA
eukprot:scaffold2129_cov318-Prasinococcus_capsulatus_cf.AAC.3